MKTSKYFVFGKLQFCIGIPITYFFFDFISTMIRISREFSSSLAENLFALFVLAVLGVFAFPLIGYLSIIRIDEKGIACYKLFRKTIISWENVAEIGMGLYYAKGVFGTNCYVSDKILSDYDRIDNGPLFKVPNGISFPFGSEVSPQKCLPLQARAAILKYYKHPLPPEFNLPKVTPRISCVIRRDGEYFLHSLNGDYYALRKNIAPGCDSELATEIKLEDK